MKKTIFALCIALSIFMCNSLSASAAVCPSAPDKVHHFTAHQRGLGVTRNGGTHPYLYGYDHEGKAIYKYDCNLILFDYYCKYKCAYCDTYEDNTQHMHNASVKHSIDHN